MTKGFADLGGGAISTFVLANPAGVQVDVHAITFDQNGNGLYQMANAENWTFPADGFTGRGTICGRPVRCLSPATQVLCHAHGYVPAEKDIRDMERLHERFGVQLPPPLRRSSR